VVADAEHALSYDDLVQIAELVKASERFFEFHLKVGDVEIELRRHRAAHDAPQTSTSQRSATGDSSRADLEAR